MCSAGRLALTAFAHTDGQDRPACLRNLQGDCGKTHERRCSHEGGVSATRPTPACTLRPPGVGQQGLSQGALQACALGHQVPAQLKVLLDRAAGVQAT